MAIITGGYDGTVDEVQFAALLHRYSVAGPEDFKATTQAGDRIVAIGNGTALGPGTVDVASNLPTIQFAAAATNTTRWDLVVLRRDWQPPGGSSTIQIIQGGAAQAYPTVGTATNQWNRRPGIMDDQPLYLQQVNGTLLGNRIDLRCWASHGGLVAKDEMVKAYLDKTGAEVYIDGVKWQRVLADNDTAQWVTGGATPYRQWFAVTTKTLTGTGGWWEVNLPAGYFTKTPMVFLTKHSAAGAGHVPYYIMDESTSSKIRIGAFWGGNANTFDVTLGIHAVQANPSTAGGMVAG